MQVNQPPVDNSFDLSYGADLTPHCLGDFERNNRRSTAFSGGMIHANKGKKSVASVLEKIGAGVQVGFIHDPIRYSLFSQGLTKLERGALVGLIYAGEIKIWHVFSTPGYPNGTYIFVPPPPPPPPPHLQFNFNEVVTYGPNNEFAGRVIRATYRHGGGYFVDIQSRSSYTDNGLSQSTAYATECKRANPDRYFWKIPPRFAE